MDVGERGEWERMEKHRKDRKIGNSDFIDSVGDNIVTNSYIRTVQINWFLWGGEDGWSWFLEGNRRNGISINVPYFSSGLCIMPH